MSEYVQDGSSSSKGAGQFWAGLLLGGLVGVGAMLLAAPQSGEDTRAEILQGGEDLRDRTTAKVEYVVAQVRGKARRLVAGAQKKTARLQRDGKEMLDEQTERVSNVVKATKQAIRDS